MFRNLRGQLVIIKIYCNSYNNVLKESSCQLRFNFWICTGPYFILELLTFLNCLNPLLMKCNYLYNDPVFPDLIKIMAELNDTQSQL